jgi:hypothetical protein
MTTYNLKFYRVNRIRFDMMPTLSFKKADGTDISFF